MPDLNDPFGNAGNEYQERRVNTRRIIRRGGDVVYGTEIETFHDNDMEGALKEHHTGAIEAACGCLIEGDVKLRSHRNGTVVCAQHYAWCGICGEELLPAALVVVEKRVYCRRCGEDAIDEMLHAEFRSPGSFDRGLVAHLRVQKRMLRGERWSRRWDRLLGRGRLPQT